MDGKNSTKPIFQQFPFKHFSNVVSSMSIFIFLGATVTNFYVFFFLSFIQFKIEFYVCCIFHCFIILCFFSMVENKHIFLSYCFCYCIYLFLLRFFSYFYIFKSHFFLVVLLETSFMLFVAIVSSILYCNF